MKLFFISILIVSAYLFPVTDDCDLNFSVQVIDTTNGLNNGELKVTFESAPKMQPKAFLYGDKRSKNRLDKNIDELRNLAAGTYTLVIQSDECSSVERDIVIE